MFAHTFPLTHGDAGQIPCATCHINPQQDTAYTCYHCHAHPQAATLAEPREEGILGHTADGVRCHALGHQ